MDMTRRHVFNGNPMEEIAGFSRAVRVGPWVSVGGTAPVGPDGKTVGVGDVAAQTRRCYEIAEAALKVAGASMADVVRTRLLLVDIADWKTATMVRREFCGEAKPVETIMAVSAFVNPEWLVEIEVDALIADRP
ncbi:RidA family protein [Albimonas sp. CAU 1670]|uniref:RidA family protein n=1 Tax=Albimonas sp. CAU 1670 TaxID=3032599 RepID=UPI0023DCA35E|nr:RidA family protein [Albimonas sp. CAU 1670]MDF2232644.1 RidA family protein [Albimonas sp. CAU 1670]